MSQGYSGWNNYDGSGYSAAPSPGFNPRGQRREQFGGMQYGGARGPNQGGMIPGMNPEAVNMAMRYKGGQTGHGLNPDVLNTGMNYANRGGYQGLGQGGSGMNREAMGTMLDYQMGQDSYRGFKPMFERLGQVNGGQQGGPFGGQAAQALRPSANPGFNPRGMRIPGQQPKPSGPFGGNALSMLRPGSSAGSMAQGGPFSGAKNIANLMPGGGSGGGFMSKLGGLGKKIGGMSTMGKVGLGMGGLGAAKLAGGYMKKRKAQKAGARQRDQQAQMGQPQQMRGPMF